MMAYSILHLNEVHPLPHPNPPLVKLKYLLLNQLSIVHPLPHPNPPLVKGREADCSCFPPLEGGIKGGNNVIKITANYFSNNLLAMG